MPPSNCEGVFLTPKSGQSRRCFRAMEPLTRVKRVSKAGGIQLWLGLSVLLDQAKRATPFIPARERDFPRLVNTKRGNPYICSGLTWTSFRGCFSLNFRVARRFPWTLCESIVKMAQIKECTGSGEKIFSMEGARYIAPCSDTVG